MAEKNPLSDIEKLTHSIAVLNDAMITFAENLGKINKLEQEVHKGDEQAIKDQQLISDMYGDSTDAMDELITMDEKQAKSSGFFGGSMNFMHSQVGKANKAMEDLSTQTLIAGDELNFFAQNRRREQIATIKSFGSLRRAIMISASFLSGVFVGAIKAVIGATSQAGQSGARRGTGIEAVVGKDMEGPASLVESGIPFMQAMESTVAMFDAGLSRNVKGMHQFTKIASILDMDMKRLGTHTRNLALTTGMSNSESVTLVATLQSTARMYNLNSEKLIHAMEKLSSATATAALLTGTETSTALQEGTGLLAAKLGVGGEDMAAKLMSSLNASNKEAFVTLTKFGVDFQKVMGSEGGQGVADEVTKFASVTMNMMKDMGANEGISYSDPLLLGMMERLTDLTAEDLVTLRSIDDSVRAVSTMTEAQILLEQEATAKRSISTNAAKQVQSLLSDIYREASSNLLPLIQATYEFLQNHGDKLRGFLTSIFTAVIDVVKGVFAMIKMLIVVKAISLFFKAAWAVKTAWDRVTHQREMINHARVQTLLQAIHLGITALPAKQAGSNIASNAASVGIGAAVARGAATGSGGGLPGILVGIGVSVAAMAVMSMFANDKLDAIGNSMTMSGDNAKLLVEMNAEIAKSEATLKEMKELAITDSVKANQKDPALSISEILQRNSIIQEDLTREMITLLQDRNDELRNVSSYARIKGPGSWGN